MIPFKKMWEDVLMSISNDKFYSVNIVESYENGFVVKEEDTTEFLNKEDFVDFWCRMLCFKEFSREEALKNHKHKYVYDIIKHLPYVCENSNILKLVD